MLLGRKEALSACPVCAGSQAVAHKASGEYGKGDRSLAEAGTEPRPGARAGPQEGHLGACLGNGKKVAS